jgi:protein required for attachment to host cells
MFMRKHLKLLIVIADGEHARFVRPSQNHALHSEGQMNAESAHERTSDLGADHPGAAYHTGSSAHHALTPRRDLHDLESLKFAHLVAHRVNELASQDTFDDLVIAAPPHSLTAIREKLNIDTQARVIGTLAKDLVKVPDEELSEHFKAWIRPVHRVKH